VREDVPEGRRVTDLVVGDPVHVARVDGDRFARVGSVSTRTSPDTPWTPRTTMRASRSSLVVSVSRTTVSGSVRTVRAHSVKEATSWRRASLACSRASWSARNCSARSRSSPSAQGGHQRGPRHVLAAPAAAISSSVAVTFRRSRPGHVRDHTANRSASNCRWITQAKRP
jgi:hypothetical protein